MRMSVLRCSARAVASASVNPVWGVGACTIDAAQTAAVAAIPIFHLVTGPPRVGMEDGTSAYSPRCHIRSTVTLIVRIEHAAKAIAANATRYVLSMARRGAS